MVFFVVQQRFAIGLALHFFGVVQRVFQGAKALDDFDRAFVADARRAGDIIDGVAAQGHHVNYLLRTDAQNFFHLGAVADQIIFRRIQHADFVIHQLQHVLVTGDDKDLIVLRGGFAAQSANHVIGLKALRLKNGNAVSFQRAPYVRHLLNEVMRHLFARCAL